MLTLRESMQVVDERKNAVMGDEHDIPGGTVRYADSPDADRAIVSGYDVDYDELLEVIEEMTIQYGTVAWEVGVKTAMKAAIADALQIGLVKGADSRA
jgi:hypothetical protein